MSVPLLQATSLDKEYVLKRNVLGRPREVHHAVRGVNLSLERGETLAVVGESGAGKSTLGRILIRLIEADRGSIRINGEEVRTLSSSQLRKVRKSMQMIFQDPYASFDPRIPIDAAIGHPLRFHFRLQGAELNRRTLDLLERVGISEDQARRYPREFSGGQLQRIATARALAVEPEFVVCDEPVAALDMSTRAQVINLLQDLQKEGGVAYIFITHDLSLVRAIADRVAIMYKGQIVEEGSPSTLFDNPQHSYTRALLEAVPVPDPRRRPLRSSSSQLTQTR